MRTSPVPLVEKMVLFWHNHFVSGQEKLYDMGLLYTQNQLFRQHALGDYHALVQGMAIDPAMLWYLDNAENVAGREQENFAREVMELFTMGQGNYTEADVITMARAWTGHNVSDDGRSYQFRSSRPRQRHQGALRRAAHQLGRARHAHRDPPRQPRRARLAVHHRQALLVPRLPGAGHRPLVATLADGFRANDLSILWLVRAILRSDAFWSPTARYALVRNPTEWFVAGMEAVGLPPSELHPEWWMEGTGQQLFYPPNVAGWKQNSYWISTASGWARSGWGSYVRWQANDAGRVRRHPDPVRRGHRHAGVRPASASSTPPPPPAPPSRRGSPGPRRRATAGRSRRTSCCSCSCPPTSSWPEEVP